MSNKKSVKFFFYEAALVKRTQLFKECENIVVGDGSLNAEIMFVGEAPGRNEDLQGKPFVGAAGKNLDKLLERIGLKREDIYIANILKCRPPMNRDPLPDEIRAHTPWLLKQIKEIKPKIICSLGNYATKFFLAGGNVDLMDNQLGITVVHGKIQDVEIEGLRFKLIPLFHPAAMLHNKSLEKFWIEDMEVVKKFVSQI
ncbi:MAG: uracil-DNA glycosylase [Candidatus Pacearchaeota archaeon]|nr:uracil-DNA glycosylase [Candidatus Pacearchaeota archaeon]